MSGLEKLKEIDIAIWEAINVQGHLPLGDLFFPILRNPITWAPLYLFLAIYIPFKFAKKGIYWCLFFILSFALADYTSASIIKPLVQRLRPCNDPILQQEILRLVDCGSGYSFPSSHASNHFALATFMVLTLGKSYKWIIIPAWLWAVSISYAQVYVGVHFPFDVLAGALLGMFIGLICSRIFNKKWAI